MIRDNQNALGGNTRGLNRSGRFQARRLDGSGNLGTFRRIPIERLVLDESGVHVAMHHTHTWVKRGAEYIERVPMNWSRTLTLLGAMRHTGLVVLQTMFATANADRFVAPG
jgi:hypothetical protein